MNIKYQGLGDHDNLTRYVTVGFTNMMTTTDTYVADIPSYANQHVVYWSVTIPPQHSTNANSGGYGLDIT